MAFEDFSSPKPDNWVTLGGVNTKTGKSNPTKIEGYYLGSVSAPSQFDDSKTKVTYMLKTPKGIEGINGSANLNFKMKDSEVNLLKRGFSALKTKVRIEFTGTKSSSKGNPTKLFTVNFDPNDTDDTAMTVAERSDVEDADDYNDDVEQNTDVEDEDESQTLALAAAERLAEVKALLKSKGTKSVKN